jgi:FKBP-type peptidyl-prolyl cis-trans isomerase
MTVAAAFLFANLASLARAFTTSSSSSAVRVRWSASTTTTPHLRATNSMPYDDDKMVFFAFGTNLALQVNGQGNFKDLLNADEMDVVLDAFKAGCRGSPLQDPVPMLNKYGPELNRILRQRAECLIDNEIKQGEEFMKTFLDRNPDAIRTESGLVFMQTKVGDGRIPVLESNVEVHYHGTLNDGTVFDSSVERGETIRFPLQNVIQGWTEGLQLMREGGK